MMTHSRSINKSAALISYVKLSFLLLLMVVVLSVKETAGQHESAGSTGSSSLGGHHQHHHHHNNHHQHQHQHQQQQQQQQSQYLLSGSSSLQPNGWSGNISYSGPQFGQQLSNLGQIMMRPLFGPMKPPAPGTATAYSYQPAAPQAPPAPQPPQPQPQPPAPSLTNNYDDQISMRVGRQNRAINTARQQQQQVLPSNQSLTSYPSSSVSSSASNYASFILDCMRTHDKYRLMHGVPPLKASKKVMRYSRKRAKELAETDIFAHPAESPFGENLAWSSKKSSSCQDLIAMWYNEIKLYNYRNPTFNTEIGHFTQMIWKDSVRIGCARGFSKRGKGVYLVCNYDPPGNILGEFREQVLPAKSGYSIASSGQSQSVTPPPVSSVPSVQTVPPTVSILDGQNQFNYKNNNKENELQHKKKKQKKHKKHQQQQQQMLQAQPQALQLINNRGDSSDPINGLEASSGFMMDASGTVSSIASSSAASSSSSSSSSSFTSTLSSLV